MSEKKEKVVAEYNGQRYELEVAAGTSSVDIEAFLRHQETADMPIGEKISRSVAEPFNRGLLSIPDLPVHLANAFSAGISIADKKIAQWLGGEGSQADPPQLVAPFTEAGLRAGVIAPEEERLTGVVPRTMELTGATMVPLGASIQYGKEALKSLSPVVGVLDDMSKLAASKPGQATAFDIASNFTAAVSGEVAAGITDNDTIIAMAELGGGFAPTLAVLAPRYAPIVIGATKGKETFLEHLAPFTEAGAKPRASRRVQDVAADPEASAQQISEGSLLPPFNQANDPDLIKLQNNILNRNPALKKKYSEQLQIAIDALQKGTDFGGDIERAVHLLNVRSQIAVEEAALAVQRLSPDASPRQISVRATKAVEGALDDATSIEKYIWKQLDQKAPANVKNATNKFDDIVAARSPDDDPADIPAWLVNKLKASPLDPKLEAQLVKQGLISEDGVIDPAIRAALERQGILKERERTLQDVIAIRSRVLREIRAERAKDAPNRNKIRILSEVQESLLDDMTETGVVGVDKAREFSRAVNERFRNGRIGRLLGFDVTGAERVAAEDMLDEVVFGRHSATTTKLFIETTSENPQLVLDYIKARYIEATRDDAGRISVGAHNTFIKNMEKKGLFELFPELRGQLVSAKETSDAARLLQVPESQVNTLRINKEQSRAALLLQANPGDEMSLILRSNNPIAAIRPIMKVIQKDLMAVNGMKTAFAKEIMRLSGKQAIDATGSVVPNGLNMRGLLKQHKPVMRALHMNDAEINRLNRVADELMKVQLKPGTGDIGAGILEDALSTPVEFLARIVGARTGGNIGQDMGSQLVLAGFFSRKARERLQNLTVSKAELLLIQAVSDPVLFRSLLTSSTATPAVQQKAAKEIERALAKLSITPSVASAGRRAAAIAATEDQ
ncbi:MAG: hypothetical protein ACYSP9_04670 [Planctomycetota bacterium]|jgi:hypothetical protein